MTGKVSRGGLQAPPRFSLNRRALAAALPALAVAPGAALAQASPPAPAPATLIGRRDRAARLATPVFINGAGPFSFVVDTGANRSVIAAEVAAALELPPGATSRVHGIAAIEDTPTVNVKSFKAGEIRLPVRDVPVLKRADLGCDGLLGIDAFTSRMVTFDFQRNVVYIDHSSAADFEEMRFRSLTVTSDVIVRARQRFGQLTIVDADAAREKITCFIDSGDQLTIGNSALLRAIRAHAGPSSAPPMMVNIRGATGQHMQGEVVVVPAMRLGGVRFTSFAVAFADVHTFDLWGLKDRPAMILGMDLLRVFQMVTVDFGQSQVRFRLSEAVDQTQLG